MRWPPAGTGFPLLAVAGLVLWIGVVDRDPVGALVVLAVLTAVVGVVDLLMLAGRGRVRRRRSRMPRGSGVWRATLDGQTLEELDPSGPLGWTVDRIVLDVVVTPSSLQLHPVAGGRVLGRCRTALLRWEEVAAVDVEARVWEIGGKPLPLPRTPVVLALVGPRVAESLRPMTDAEAVADGLSPQERAEEDAETRADAEEGYGPGYRWGTQPMRLLVDDAADLVPLLERYRRGVVRT